MAVYTKGSTYEYNKAVDLLQHSTQIYHPRMQVVTEEMSGHTKFLESAIISTATSIELIHFNKNQESLALLGKQSVHRYVPFSSYSKRQSKLNVVNSALNRLHHTSSNSGGRLIVFV